MGLLFLLFPIFISFLSAAETGRHKTKAVCYADRRPLSNYIPKPESLTLCQQGGQSEITLQLKDSLQEAELQEIQEPALLQCFPPYR